MVEGARSEATSHADLTLGIRIIEGTRELQRYAYQFFLLPVEQTHLLATSRIPRCASAGVAMMASCRFLG